MKRWKMLACLVMACMMTLSLIGCGGGGSTPAPADDDKTPASDNGGSTGGDAGGEKIVWRLAHTCTEDIALHIMAVQIAEEISEETNGNFVIEVYPNSQLGGNREALEGMQFGTIEMTIPNVGSLGGYSDSITALELPYIISDISNFDDANAVYNTDVMQPVYDELAQSGIKWVASWCQGIRHLTTTKTPVHTPADMKGLKIRTMESEMHMAHFNALGANAVPMAFSEVFTALQQGAIDGQENPYCNIYTQGMHEVQGYIIETAHIFDITPVLVAQSAFDALPAEYQELLVNKFFNATLDEWQMSMDQNDEYKQMILDTGKCEIIELSTEERQAFRDAAQPVYDQYIEKHGSDFLDAIANAQK